LFAAAETLTLKALKAEDVFAKKETLFNVAS